VTGRISKIPKQCWSYNCGIIQGHFTRSLSKQLHIPRWILFKSRFYYLAMFVRFFLFHNTTAQTPLIAPIDESLEDVSDSAHIPPFDGSVGKLNRSAGSWGVLTINTSPLHISIGLVGICVVLFFLVGTFINDNIPMAAMRRAMPPISPRLDSAFRE